MMIKSPTPPQASSFIPISVLAGLETQNCSVAFVSKIQDLIIHKKDTFDA
jgi:hypothetical protein